LNEKKGAFGFSFSRPFFFFGGFLLTHNFFPGRLPLLVCGVVESFSFKAGVYFVPIYSFRLVNRATASNLFVQACLKEMEVIHFPKFSSHQLFLSHPPCAPHVLLEDAKKGEFLPFAFGNMLRYIPHDFSTSTSISARPRRGSLLVLLAHHRSTIKHHKLSHHTLGHLQLRPQ
jgi:hypothetical protein